MWNNWLLRLVETWRASKFEELVVSEDESRVRSESTNISFLHVNILLVHIPRESKVADLDHIIIRQQ